MRLLIPSYFYPTDPAWDALIKSASQVQINAIINPHNGPGDEFNSDYQDLCVRLRKAGVGISGYVSTRWGERPISEVDGDIIRYQDFYKVCDIFLDEAATSVEMLPYYKELYGRSLGWIILNHGTIPEEDYLTCGDILVIFESSYAKHTLERFPAWLKKHHKHRFAQIIHSCPDTRRMRRAMAKIGETSDYAYITDDVEETDNNPYDQLPTYWAQEVKACG